MSDWNPEPIVVTTIREEGQPDRVIGHGWPNEIEITRELLVLADRRYVEHDEQSITFRFANGTARYLIVSDMGDDGLQARLESSEMTS